MKQFILTSIVACGIAFTANAGNHFKTIHYTSYWSETQKSGLDMEIGSSPISSMSTWAAGDIIINTEDSTLSIGAKGATPEVYKLTRIDEMLDDKNRSCQSVYLTVKNKEGADYSVSVERHYDLRFVKVFFFPKGSDTYRVYGCDYLKKLK